MDWQLFKTDDYFAVDLLHDEWEDIGKVSYYRRPLTSIASALKHAGFRIESLVEPQPTAEFQRVDPAGYERLMKSPGFLVIRADKRP
jgi:hypothetical protein